MVRIGILGDIGSGKSYTAKSFGYPVFDADIEVGKLYKKDRKIFNKLKKVLPKYIYSFPIKKSEISEAILANKSNLKKIVNNNPEWLKKTQLLSEKTLKLRDEIKKANDPIDICIVVLPSLFKNKMELFNTSLQELNSFYNIKIEEFKSKILSSFNIKDDMSYYSEINERSLNIMKKTGDHSLDPFVFQMSNFNGSQQSVENLILTLLKKDPKSINDNDIDRFNINLSIAVDDFKKVEAHTKISKRKYKMSSMSFVFGGAEKKDPVFYDFKLTTNEKKEAKKIALNIKTTIDQDFNQTSFTNDNKNNIIFGAVSQYLEELLDKKDGEKI